MSKSLPDFVSDEPVSTSAEAPVVEATETAPAAQAEPEAPTSAPAAGGGQPRGADGKFAPVVTPAAAPVAQAAPPVAQPVVADPAPAPVAPVPETPPPVPLATALEWRDRMSTAEKEAKELREWRAQQEAQRRATPPPTFAEDPEAAAAHQREQFEQARFEDRRDISRRFAEQQHGKETVETAFQWAVKQIDQELQQFGRSALNDAVLRSPDPVDHVVQQWRRDQIASQVDPTEFEAFRAWQQGQQAQPVTDPALAQPAAAPAAIPQAPAAPRQSLASAPSAASSAAPIPRNGESTYSALFGG